MDGKIDIKVLVKKVISKWYYFLAIGIIMLPLAYLYTKFTDRVYQVRASILLGNEMKNGIRSEKFLKGMELLASNTQLEDEIGILKSYNMVGSAIMKLDFGVSYFQKENFRSIEKYGRDRPFIVELDSAADQMVNVPVYIERTSESTYRIAVSGENIPTHNFYTGKHGDNVAFVEIDAQASNGKPFRHKHLGFTLRFNHPFAPVSPSKKYFFVIYNPAAVTQHYQNKLEINPISRESNIVELKVSGTVPDKEILFLNTLLDVYLENELSKENQLGLKTIEFIDEQLSGVSNELREVEGSLESFRSRNNILDIEATAENLTRNLNRLEIDKSNLESKLKYYKYIARSLDDQDNPKSIQSPSTFGLEDPFLNDLLLEYAKLNQERTGLNYSRKESNPVVEVIDLKIANNKKALLANVTNFIEASSMALEDLNAQIAEIHRSIKGLPKSQREMVNIQRRFDFNDNVYNYLLEKRAEAGIAIASNTVEKTIVDRAQQVGGGPVAPNVKAILASAVSLTVFLSLALIIVMDVANDKIVTTEDLEKNTRVPLIGTITHGSKQDRTSLIVANSRSALGESFRSLRVNLQYLMPSTEKQVIGVTSSLQGEGKSFCACSLSVAMAQSGRRTVLLDADMRRPSVASSFKLNNEKGLSSFLIGSCTMPDIIKATETENLHVITSGPALPNPADLLGVPAMEFLITTLKAEYDTVIIDSPPVGAVSDYIILMKFATATICVVRSNYTNRNQLGKVNNLYDNRKIGNVSMLLNDVRSSVKGYYYPYHK